MAIRLVGLEFVFIHMHYCTTTRKLSRISNGNPTLCESHPLVTPYNCRLGDLLCLFVYASFVCCFLCVYAYV